MEASTSAATPSTSKIEPSTSTESPTPEEPMIVKKDYLELQYFECALCQLREKYEYFGKEPPFYKCFLLKEDAYVIEDPFVPPKQGEILILGAHCVSCNIMVCKDPNCSIFCDGTYCVKCAKGDAKKFPKVVQEKLNKIVI